MRWKEQKKSLLFKDLLLFLLSWLSELWILAAGSENVKNSAPVIPGVGHHHEKRKAKYEPAHSSAQLPTTCFVRPQYMSLLIGRHQKKCNYEAEKKCLIFAI